MTTSVGSVQASIVPEVSGFASRADATLTPSVERLGQKLGRTLSRSMTRSLDFSGIDNALRRSLDAAEASAASKGRQIGKRYGQAMKAGLSAELRGLQGTLDVSIRPVLDRTAYRAVQADLDVLTRARTLTITADADTRAAADDLALLTRPRSVTIRADADTAAAAARLADLTRNRTTTIHANVNGSQAGQASSLISRITGASSSAGGAVAGLASKVALLGSAAPLVGSLVNVIAAIAPAAALAAPAVAAVGSAIGAIKLGTAGLGDAFKAAFAPADASKAVSSAKQVASAERAVKQAVDQVSVARENAAAANQAAVRSVTSAERDLVSSQQAARQAQQDLNAAREEAVQNLRDLNQQLAHSALDQRSATLAVKQAQEDLYKVLADPKASELQRQQAQLTYDQAVQNLEDQKQKQKDLKKEVDAANKAGVEGSKVVLAAKQAQAQANQDVRDKELALADARTAQAKTARDGARSIAEAQQAVADAQQRVADAQQSAVAQTSKLDDALAKLSPNARTFVGAVKGLGPAWTGMRLAVQDRLLAGLGTRLTSLGKTAIPVLKEGLTGTAGVLNTMAKNAMSAVENMAKAGMLKQILDGATKSLEPLKKAPGQLVTAFGQVAIAAQPTSLKLSKSASNAISGVTDKLTKAFESGAMEKAIQHAVDLIGDLMDVAGNVFDILGDIFMAGSETGGGTIQVLKTITEEISKITSSPEVQAGLKALFSVMGTIAKTVAPLLGAALKIIGKVFEKLGPPVESLVKTLGDALGPVLDALGPVLIEVAGAVGSILKAFGPLLPVLGQLLATALKPLAPIFKIIADVISQMAPVIAEVAVGLGQALTPILMGLGKILGEIVKQYAAMFLQILMDLMPAVQPVIGALVVLGKSLGQILTAVAPLIPQILLLGTKLLAALLPAIVKILPVVAQVVTILIKLATWLILKVVIPALSALVRSATWVATKLGAAFHWLWKNVVKPVFGWIADKAKWVYNKGIKPAFDWIRGAISGLGDKFKALYNSYIRPAFGWIADKARWLYDKGVKAPFDWIKKGVGKVAEAFGDAKDNIGEAWSKVSELAKAPIKFVIDTVYNHGIVPLWNKVADFVGADTLKEWHPKGWARGGILPGQSSYRDGDDQLVPMRRGEGVYVSEAMRDPYERARLYAVNAAALKGENLTRFRVAGFAGGGVIGSATDFITHPVKSWNKATGWLHDKIDELGSSKWAQAAAKVPLKMLSGLKDTLVDAAKALVTGSYTKELKGMEKLVGNLMFPKAVSRWSGTVLQALKLVDQPSSLLPVVLRRLQQESGGNPTIVNKWDSNWIAGHPSVGLMQVIGPTFRSYAGKFRKTGPFLYGTSVNPLANIYSSMKYAMAAYGSLSRAYNRAGGYAKGGFPRMGEVAWVGEEGPELVRFLPGGIEVIPHQKSVQMAAQMGPVPGYAKGGVISATGKSSIAAVIGKAFLDGLQGTTTEIKNAVAKVTTAIKNAFKGVKSSIDDKLLKSLASSSTKLQALATKRDKIAADIAAAQQLAKDQTATGLSFASMTSLPNGGNTFDAAGIPSGLNVRLGQLKTFSANLGKLAKMGLSKELLQQIISAGPDSGAAYAQALVNATPAELKSINATQAAIEKASSSYGNAAADALYDAGTKAGDGFLTGLKAQEKAIENEMSVLAKKIQAAIKKALKIKSPSRVMAEIGENVGQGLAMGMDATHTAIVSSSNRLAIAAQSGVRAEPASRSERGGDVHFYVTTTDKPTKKAVVDALRDYAALYSPLVA
ncbi:transglycosylase SLT domain-containing protein [Streptomyces milbemycinicus]|uniref:transglycosylase SLT domain-containing protein n=1 Tax=Streptomyces milbemycinicus TaxID=476552 RepID=UPI00340D5F82